MGERYLDKGMVKRSRFLFYRGKMDAKEKSMGKRESIVISRKTKIIATKAMIATFVISLFPWLYM